ncbi:MAG: ligT like phosphoesterase [Clostridiales bacterium]|nr:ligT like phosphoesterase [Clostridiales bacterium]
METYREFLDRINTFEKKEIVFGGERFECSPSVALKVAEDNTFRNFYGDTVVFDLPGVVKEKLAEYVDQLYAAVPPCFCERLVPHTFHATLHDLSNAPTLSSVAEETFRNELKVVEIKDEIRKLAGNGIRFKSKYIFNMVNTSLVLGLYPEGESNYERLMKLYSVFDGVKKLPYPLTPHITLAYYNVNGFDGRAAEGLADAVNKINAELDLSVCVRYLYYQKFTSMNNYIDVIELN